MVWELVAFAFLIFLTIPICCHVIEIRLEEIVDILEKVQKSFNAIKRELNQGNDEKRL